MTKTTRRQPEREDGGYAEGVVDRGADVAVRGGEERVRPENALELVRLAAPPCHGVTVKPAAVAPAPATGPVAIITRHGASRSSRRISRGKARWKPRRDSTGAPTTTSSARRSVATRATSSPRLPGRVRTISCRTATPYELATALAVSIRAFRLTELPVEVRIDRQLALEDGGRDEHDSGAPICGEPAGEIERVLRLLPVEQRHDDAAVGDRARPAREPRARWSI